MRRRPRERGRRRTPACVGGHAPVGRCGPSHDRVEVDLPHPTTVQCGAEQAQRAVGEDGEVVDGRSPVTRCRTGAMSQMRLLDAVDDRIDSSPRITPMLVPTNTTLGSIGSTTTAMAGAMIASAGPCSVRVGVAHAARHEVSDAVVPPHGVDEACRRRRRSASPSQRRDVARPVAPRDRAGARRHR